MAKSEYYLRYVGMSVCPHGITHGALNVFLFYIVLILPKTSWRNSSLVKIWQKLRALYWKIHGWYTFALASNPDRNCFICSVRAEAEERCNYLKVTIIRKSVEWSEAEKKRNQDFLHSSHFLVVTRYMLVAVYTMFRDSFENLQDRLSQNVRKN